MLVVRTGERSVAKASASAMTRALVGPELEVRVVREEGVILGDFQRTSEASAIARRASGGAAVNVGPGTVHAVLALPTLDALVVDCDPRRVLNRYARPLLKAITKVSVMASYSGRDWVSVARHPCAYVAFAHEARTQRASFEAFVAVKTPFHAGERASYREKEPKTLEQIMEREIDPARVAREIARAYASAYDLEEEARAIEDDPAPLPLVSEPWLARAEEAIGPIFADRTRVGGELMASRDAMQQLTEELDRAPDDRRAIGAIIDATLGRREVALEGVRALTSVLDVVTRARGM